MRRATWIALPLCLALPMVVGILSGIATRAGVQEWYPGLNKPGFNPPNWVFGPVWTLLYLLMGVGLYMIWSAPRSSARSLALAAFGLQLALNAAWSFLFFRFRLIDAALADILLLLVGIIVMVAAFARVGRLAALLQTPYLAWVGFATVLNAALAKLN